MQKKTINKKRKEWLVWLRWVEEQRGAKLQIYHLQWMSRSELSKCTLFSHCISNWITVRTLITMWWNESARVCVCACMLERTELYIRIIFRSVEANDKSNLHYGSWLVFSVFANVVICMCVCACVCVLHAKWTKDERRRKKNRLKQI